MKIRFLGGAGGVTGSKYLLEAGGKRILVDCGLFQGLKPLRRQNWDPLPVDPESISAVVLTHAHVDHSGYLPKLVKEGFHGKIFCTMSTRDLCRIMLVDSARLMEEEADYANKLRYSKHDPALPLYTTEEAERALQYFKHVELHKETEVAGFRFELGRSGHILGAANVKITSPDGVTIAFSGDIGRPHDPIMLAPEPLPAADYFVIESTYGDRAHPSADPAMLVAEIVRKAVARKGSVLIPSFAVGRAQHLLYIFAELKKKDAIPDVPVYLDSPMAADVTGIYREALGEHRLSPEQCRRICTEARFIRNLDESLALSLRREPRIVISASGMATGGRVLHHLKTMGPRPENTLLFPGYQAPGTRGAQILGGATEVKVHGEYVPIRCEVCYVAGLSAHADYREIITWLGDSTRPKVCFITHGEASASDSLRLRLKDALGYTCRVPALGETATLS